VVVATVVGLASAVRGSGADRTTSVAGASEGRWPEAVRTTPAADSAITMATISLLIVRW
jgi:hypothetical protein